MRFLIFNKTSGQILRVVGCPPDMIELQVDNSTDYMEYPNLINTSTYYILNGEIVSRPTFSERILGTTVDNLPIPTTVITNGNSYTITDGSAELSFSLPGTYKVYLSSFPYQDKVVEVTQV